MMLVLVYPKLCKVCACSGIACLAIACVCPVIACLCPVIVCLAIACVNTHLEIACLCLVIVCLVIACLTIECVALFLVIACRVHSDLSFPILACVNDCDSTFCLPVYPSYMLQRFHYFLQSKRVNRRA